MQGFDGIVIGLSYYSSGVVRLHLEPCNKEPKNQTLFFVEVAPPEIKYLLHRRLWGTTKIMCGWFEIGERLGHNRLAILPHGLQEVVLTDAGKQKKNKRKAG